MQLPHPTNLTALRPLFAPLAHHLVVDSILAGHTQAPLLVVDDPTHPTAAAARFHHKLLLGGSSQNQAYNQALGELLTEQVFPQARQAGQDGFVVWVSEPGWYEQFPALFGDTFGRQIEGAREYYRWQSGHSALPAGWRELLPPGGILRPVDRALLDRTGLRHLDELVEETQSERHSVEDFLSHSFGVALELDGALAAWCLSEYNLDGRCEVGIATMEEYQRRGFGTLVGAALIDTALAQGCTNIGWDCWKRNEPSARLARRLGYHLACEEQVTICLF